MKKIKLFLLLALAGPSVFAQFDLGIKGGVSTSKIYTNAGSFKNNYRQSLDTKTGYVFGVYATLGRKLYFQPEVLFASKGGKVQVVPTTGGNPLEVNIKTNNIDVPLLIGYKLLGKIKLHAGPVVSIKINEDEKFVTELRKVTGDLDAAFETATFGFQAGVGVRLLGFNIDVRKDGSLSNISKTKFPSGGNNSFDQRLAGWQFTIGRNIF